MRLVAALAAVLVICVLAACGGSGDDRGDAGPADDESTGIAAGPSGGTADVMANLFPVDGFEAGWTRRGKTVVYDSAELYGYINGGAEIFLDLGFDRVAVQKYNAGRGEITSGEITSGEITVDIYQMTDPAAALGIYLMKCGRETPSPKLDAVRHTVNRFQLLAVKGNVYLCVSDLDGREQTGDTLLAFARHVTNLIPAAATSPDGMFDLLPKEGRIAGSERVIRGQFTLQAIYTLGPGDVLRLGGEITAVAADYDRGAGRPAETCIAALYPDEAAVIDAFEHLVANLDSYLEVVEKGDARLVFEDYDHEFGVVERRDRRLDIRLHLADGQ